MEYIDGGSLHSLLQHVDQGKSKLSWARRRNRALQMVKGVVALHHPSTGSFSSIAITNRPTSLSISLKLTDFGASKLFERATEDTSGDLQQGLGGNTLLYIAPDLLGNAVHSRKTDMWSVGITLLELCTA